jgi:hypothetical protein
VDRLRVDAYKLAIERLLTGGDVESLDTAGRTGGAVEVDILSILGDLDTDCIAR